MPCTWRYKGMSRVSLYAVVLHQGYILNTGWTRGNFMLTNDKSALFRLQENIYVSATPCLIRRKCISKQTNSLVLQALQKYFWWIIRSSVVYCAYISWNNTGNVVKNICCMRDIFTCMFRHKESLVCQQASWLQDSTAKTIKTILVWEQHCCVHTF